MKKAILIIMTIVLFMQLTLLQPIQSQAVGVDTVVKLVGGKALIRAIAEKAGMTLSKKQVDNVAGYIQKKSYDGDQNAINFSNAMNNLPFTESSKSGFKKYVIDPINWITGLDIILTAVTAFQMGYDGGQPVPLYNQCLASPVGMAGYSGYVWYKVEGYGEYVKTWTNAQGAITISGKSITYTNAGYVYTFTKQTNGGYTIDNGTTYPTNPTHTMLGDVQVFGTSASMVCSQPVTDQDLINTTTVDPVVINYFDNDTYNNDTTYVLEVDVPDSVNYDDMTPWNAPDPLLGEALATEEPDRDGDGIPDSLDEFPDDPTNEPTDKPTGSSWWEWLLEPLKAIGDFFLGITEWLLGLLIPSADSVSGIFDGISTDFKAKLPIADQLGSFFGEIEKATVQEATAPTFEMTLPEDWGGGTFSIIDFSYFEEWRMWILNFIRFSAWFIFLKRMYNRVPKMIY